MSVALLFVDSHGSPGMISTESKVTDFLESVSLVEAICLTTIYGQLCHCGWQMKVFSSGMLRTDNFIEIHSAANVMFLWGYSDN
jgi:hypothetical protein